MPCVVFQTGQHQCRVYVFRRDRMKVGMALAIEPMVNAGGPEVYISSDGWTALTVDGTLSAHFERSVAVTQDGPWILGGEAEVA